MGRHLGPAQYGELAAILALGATLSSVCGFGLPALWVKRAAKSYAAALHWVGPSTTFAGFSTALAVCAFGALVLSEHGTSRPFFFPLVLTLLSAAAVELVLGINQSRGRFYTYALWQIVPPVIRGAVVVSALAISVQFRNALALSLILSGIAAVVIAAALVPLVALRAEASSSSQHKRPSTRARRRDVLAVALSATPFGLAAVSYMLNSQVAVISVSRFEGAAAAGSYAAAATLMAGIYLLPGVIYQKFLASQIHKWAYDSSARLLQLYRVGNVIMGVAGLAVALGIAASSKWIVAILFGPDYASSAALLAYLSACVPLRFIVANAGAALTTRNHMGAKAKFMAFAAFVNLIACWVLVSRHGAVGAVCAAVVSEALLLGLYMAYARTRVFRADQLFAAPVKLAANHR